MASSTTHALGAISAYLESRVCDLERDLQTIEYGNNFAYSNPTTLDRIRQLRKSISAFRLVAAQVQADIAWHQKQAVAS